MTYDLSDIIERFGAKVGDTVSLYSDDFGQTVEVRINDMFVGTAKAEEHDGTSE